VRKLQPKPLWPSRTSCALPPERGNKCISNSRIIRPAAFAVKPQPSLTLSRSVISARTLKSTLVSAHNNLGCRRRSNSKSTASATMFAPIPRLLCSTSSATNSASLAPSTAAAKGMWRLHRPDRWQRAAFLPDSRPRRCSQAHHHNRRDRAERPSPSRAAGFSGCRRLPMRLLHAWNDYEQRRAP
jgi:hypothetical protein